MLHEVYVMVWFEKLPNACDKVASYSASHGKTFLFGSKCVFDYMNVEFWTTFHTICSQSA